MPGAANPRVQPLCFGDLPRSSREGQAAAVISFSARGLEKFGVPPAQGTDGLATFSGVFNMGMCERGRVLGDPPFVPDDGGWSDRDAEAALFVYGRSDTERDQLIDCHIGLLSECGGRAIAIIRTAPVVPSDPDPFSREHFGFRDGISQPIIRGTQRFSLEALPRDVVEPGEFIFGYANNLGYFPPSPVVRAESDPGRHLSTPMPSGEAGPEATTSNFPDFDALDLPYLPRDLGRNGTFLVIRQLVQHAPEFETFTEQKANEVREQYPQLDRLLGKPVNADWIAAKMVGRWRDGTPLIDRLNASRVKASCSADPKGAAYGRDDARAVERGRGKQTGVSDSDSDLPDNDFSYGVDDPSGLQCPLGAHIRRANPRDSLQPGDAEEQSITNRHRLLRRGRSYQENNEKGLLFVALCADLERQFEFVQQTWLGSPSFHGLTSEYDPIAAPNAAVGNRVFTIPTAYGPIILRDMKSFVTVKAGGYYFLPSRSALEYLIELQRTNPPCS